MYQNDIAELGREEVDWAGGSLNRPRSKTPKGPCVRYKLWPETFALLKRFKSKADVDNGRGGNRAILTDEDKPLVRQWIEGGKMRRYDTIRSALLTTAEKTGIGKSPKLFRKTSASELASSLHAPLVDIFLCHSPKSLADKHYVALTDDVLDGAMTYLHGRYFGGGKTPDGVTRPGGRVPPGEIDRQSPPPPQWQPCGPLRIFPPRIFRDRPFEKFSAPAIRSSATLRRKMLHERA